MNATSAALANMRADLASLQRIEAEVAGDAERLERVRRTIEQTRREITALECVGPAIAVCEWKWRASAAYPFAKLIEDEAPTECRASIGAKIVTVWLPQGAVIRMRRSRLGNGNAFEETFRHVYGRERQSRIDIKLRRVEEKTKTPRTNAEKSAAVRRRKGLPPVVVVAR